MSADACASRPVPDSGTFLSQMRPALLRYFRRKTGSAVEAEDLTQDVLMRSLAHRQWNSLEDAKGYLFRCAVNRWHDRHRQSRGGARAVEWTAEAEENAGTEIPPERVLIAREELNQIFAALEEMNERTRSVLILVKVEGMKVAEVADMLGISHRAVNKQLAKGMQVLMRLRKRQEWVR